MGVPVHIENCGSRFDCADGLDVLRGMEQLGRRGIPVGCRGGGCGVCKVRVLSGDYRTGVMSRACVSVDEQRDGYALACKLVPLTALRIEVVGQMVRAFDTPGTGFHRYGAPPQRET